jgi:hypothetical protein
MNHPLIQHLTNIAVAFAIGLFFGGLALLIENVWLR